MAVASAHRIARDNRDSAAEALPFEGLFILAHEFSLRSSARRISIEATAIRWIERLQRSGGYLRPPSLVTRHLIAGEAPAAGGLPPHELSRPAPP